VADGGNLAVTRKRVLDRKAESAKSSSSAGEKMRSWLANTLRWFASPRLDIGNHNRGHRRTIPKRRGVGIGDGVLQVEESRRCARILASPGFSTPERPWPTPNGFGNAGSKQNNFAEFGATIFHSKRRRGLNIRAVRNRSAARHTDFAMAKAVR
jgi:hypothetical protein